MTAAWLVGRGLNPAGPCCHFEACRCARVTILKPTGSASARVIWRPTGAADARGLPF
jgi:hypothetical protein